MARYATVVPKLVNAPETNQLFVKQVIELQSGAADEFAARIRHELAENRALVKRAGAAAE